MHMLAESSSRMVDRAAEHEGGCRNLGSIQPATKLIPPFRATLQYRSTLKNTAIRLALKLGLPPLPSRKLSVDTREVVSTPLHLADR
jgi:hypothetical protein